MCPISCSIAPMPVAAEAHTVPRSPVSSISTSGSTGRASAKTFGISATDAGQLHIVPPPKSPSPPPPRAVWPRPTFAARSQRVNAITAHTLSTP